MTTPGTDERDQACKRWLEDSHTVDRLEAQMSTFDFNAGWAAAIAATHPD